MIGRAARRLGMEPRSRAFRGGALAFLFVAIVLGERAGLISLVGWTRPLVDRSLLPWLLGALFAGWLLASRAGSTTRTQVLLAASGVAAVLFDPTLALNVTAFLVVYHAVLFSRLHRWLKHAFLIASFLGMAVVCNAVLLPDLHARHPIVSAWGYAFMMLYAFRLIRFHHEMTLRGFARVPFDRFLLYFLFAPFYVIVPYMLVIPRWDRFSASLLDPEEKRIDVELVGLRRIAIGAAISIGAAVVRTTFDPRGYLAALALDRNWVDAAPVALLAYPVFNVLETAGVAAILTGLLNVLGIRIAPPLDEPLLAGSVLEWWRRWNTHFRELLVDLFFYPVALRWKKRPYLSLVLGSAAVFLVGSTILHYIKHYFSYGTHLRPQPTVWIENVLMGLIVSISLCWERRRRERRPRVATAHPVVRGLRMVRTWAIVFVTVVACGIPVHHAMLVAPVERVLAAAAAARTPEELNALVPALRREHHKAPHDARVSGALAAALAAQSDTTEQTPWPRMSQTRSETSSEPTSTP